MASDREFLKGNRAPTPELMPGMDQDDTQGVKYKRAEDMSDSEEAEMDMSDEEDGDGQPARKRAKTETTVADNNVAHQWSNPDPYTALPPPDESQRRKKDVVKLIRKARVGTGSGTKIKPETAPDDFISLDFGAESDDADFEPERSGRGVAGAPSGPKALLQARHTLSTPKTISFPAHLNDISNMSPKTRNVSDLTRDDNLGNRKRNAYDEVKAHSSVLDTRLDPNLGSRKRTARDEIINPPPMIYKTTRGKPPSVDGKVLKEWLVPRGEAGTPWLISDHSDTARMGVWYV
jgi:non-canonical poly(A) RNA polymerase PAPD5/7